MSQVGASGDAEIRTAPAEPGAGPRTHRRRPSLANISLATRLSLVALLVTLTSLAVTATVGLVRGSDLADQLFEDRLVSVAAARAASVQFAVSSYQREIAALAASPAASDSITTLTAAYRELEAAGTPDSPTDELTDFYLSEVVPALEDVRGPGVIASGLLPLGTAAIYLQDAYSIPRATSSEPDDPTIDPALVVDPGDGSTYSSLHPAVHKTYGQIASSSGFDDIYLISADSHVIVYSARKRIDFATSLDVGPHSGSALARLLDTIESDPAGGVRMSDLSAYVPASERPTAFVAAPVLDGGELVGFVAAALDVDTFDEILSGGSWDAYGRTGEAYLVGSDGLTRTTSRAYASSPGAFLAAAREPGPGQLDEDQIRRISATGTTALVQPVDRRLLATAEERANGVVDAVAYDGERVRAAYQEVAIDDVTWTLIAEVRRSDLDTPIEDYARNMLFAVALFIVAVTFISVRWSDRVVEPIRAVAARLRHVRSDATADAPPPAAAPSGDGPLEYAELSDNVDQMLDRLRARQIAVDQRSAERTTLLGQFLPAAVARRSEQGAGEVLDHVRNASVVVLTFDGVAGLVGERPDQEVRDLLGELIDEVDALAAELGVERIKLTGSAYYAVCGVSRPFLDHAPRSVEFGLAADEAVAEMSGGALTVRGGVAAGSVSVGLAARSALIYDVWGETVSQAEELAFAAPAGAVMVSASVRDQLPGDFVVTGGDDGGSAAVTGRVTREEGT